MLIAAAITTVFLTACDPLPPSQDDPESAAAPESPRADQALTLDASATYGLAALRASPTDGLSVAERLAVYQLAAGADGAGAAAHLESTFAQPPSPERELMRSLLIERLAELDPLTAAEAVARHDLGLDGELLTHVFREAARTDREAALDTVIEFAETTASSHIPRIATVLLDEIRDDARLLGAWLDMADELQAANARRTNSLGGRLLTFTGNLHVDGIAALAMLDMELALERSLALDGALRTNVLRRIGGVWGTTDPERALALSLSLADVESRTELRRSVFGSWGQKDPMAAMRYAASNLDPDDGSNRALLLGLSNGVAAAINMGTKPADVLALAERLPFEVANRIRSAVIQSIARNDPLSAAAMIDSLAGDQRSAVYRTVADAMTELDPVAAFNWANAQKEPDLEQRVLGIIARRDRALALELALGGTARSPAEALSEVVGTIVDDDPDAAQGLARQLTETLATSTSLYQNTIRELINEWMREEPEAALDWAVTEGSGLSTTTWYEILDRVSRRPELAEAYAHRLPTEAAKDLARKTAYQLAYRDPDGAIGWIRQFSGEPETYHGGMIGIIQQLAHSDVRRGARLLTELPQDADVAARRYAAESFATTWAEDNPRAAAEWAASLDDEVIRHSALSRVARVWSQQDSAASRSWILGLPPGPSRDEALIEHLVYTVREQLPGADYMDAFGSEHARSRAVFNLIANLAGADMSRMRDWVERTQLAPQLREQAESAIAQLKRARSGAGSTLPPGTPFTIPVTLTMPESD